MRTVWIMLGALLLGSIIGFAIYVTRQQSTLRRQHQLDRADIERLIKEGQPTPAQIKRRLDQAIDQLTPDQARRIVRKGLAASERSEARKLLSPSSPSARRPSAGAPSVQQKPRTGAPQGRRTPRTAPKRPPRVQPKQPQPRSAPPSPTGAPTPSGSPPPRCVNPLPLLCDQQLLPPSLLP